jgi:hypothetical protein
MNPKGVCVFLSKIFADEERPSLPNFGEYVLLGSWVNKGIQQVVGRLRLCNHRHMLPMRRCELCGRVGSCSINLIKPNMLAVVPPAR